MRTLLRRPSPAMVVACLALFVASAGTSIAAKHYLITSTKQIKPSVLKQLKGAKGPRGLTGAQGAAGATGAQGAQGAAGATGAQGAQGQQGAAGAAGHNGATQVAVYSAASTSAAGSTNPAVVDVNCPAGTVATGGAAGYNATGAGYQPRVALSVALPGGASTPTGWRAMVYDEANTGNLHATVSVICASP